MKYIQTMLLTFCFLAQTAFANDAFILEMQKKYKEIDSFSADFTQELFNRENHYTQTKAGTFSFKKEMNLYFNVKSPNPELLIANKKEVWNYFPNEEVAFKYNASLIQNSNNILSVITGQVALNEEFEVDKKEEITLNNNIVICYHVYPLEPSVELTQAKIYINKDTKLIEAVEAYDFAGNTNYIVFQNFSINPKLNKSLFSFTPPKGIDIEDQTDVESIMNLGQ